MTESPPDPADAAVPDAGPEAPPAPPLIPLVEPREGTPEPIDTPEGLAEAVTALAGGTGPIAVDVERASAYRYTSRAYLVQLRRRRSGSFLIDPLPFHGLGALAEVLSQAEWVLHAASQDLPSLLGEGLRPTRLFDTELAGRLLGYPRVNLGAMVAEVLGFELEKGHSAADWSKRPLPQPWLRYAALDVELLLELRDVLEQQLADAGKLTWAEEEFAALADAPPAAPRVDPWRRTSGIHKLRRPRQLAVVRSVWTARDVVAGQRDSAPSRILTDGAIIDMATAPPKSVRELMALPGFANSRSERRHAATWLEAVAAAHELPDDELPPVTTAVSGPPPPRSWADRDPEAAARLTALRSAVTELAETHGLPVENLVTPDAVRRLAWDPPMVATAETVGDALRQARVREWQIGLVAELFAERLAEVAADGGLEPETPDVEGPPTAT